MNRVSTLIIGALFAIAGIEFGLLGASAAGLTGTTDRALPPVSERLGVDDTPLPAITATPTPCIYLNCATPTAYFPPTATPASCGEDVCPTPTPPLSPPPCDPEAQFCPTATPMPPLSPPQLSPPSVIAAGMDIRAYPLTIECDGFDRSTVTVRIFDEYGNPVPDGTFVSFNPYNGNADPWFAYTYDGYAATQVSFYGDLFPYGPNVIIEAGLLQAGIRVRCNPQSNSCPELWPESPPVSGPCTEPTPFPPSPPYPCNPSPGSGPLSPPCEQEPPCAVSPPSVSPPCEKPPASPPTAFELALDCDTAAIGIQTYCFGTPSSAHDVAVVLTNMSGSEVNLAAFNFTVNNADSTTLNPLPGADSSPPQFNDNPDFNEGAINAPGWTCLPVIPDLSPGGATSASLLSCFNGGGSVTIADGESIVLAVVHYATGSTPNGPAFLSIVDGAFYSADVFLEIGSCNPRIEVEMNCHGALVEIPYPSPPNGPIVTVTRPAPSATRPASTSTPVPTATRVRTATAPPRTATVAPTRTPTRGNRCADINGDGRVNRADISEIVRRTHRGPYIAKYDINRDGMLGHGDVIAAMRQLGRRC